MPSIIFNTNRNHLDIVAKGKYLPTLKEFFSIGITFCLTVIAWIFFRAENVTHALKYLSKIFSTSLFTMPTITGSGSLGIIMVLFLIIEWFGREEQFAIANFGIRWKRPLRYSMYYAIIIAILWFGGKEQQFIYFQF
jgi:hypothetical protein